MLVNTEFTQSNKHTKARTSRSVVVDNETLIIRNTKRVVNLGPASCYHIKLKLFLASKN